MVVILHVFGALARALSVVAVIVSGGSSVRVRRLGAVACLTRIIGGRHHILLIEGSVCEMRSLGKLGNTHATKYSETYNPKNRAYP